MKTHAAESTESTKAKHTPGPWKAHRIGAFNYRISTDHGAPPNFGVVHEVRCAENAGLIAAAPELLEALKALLAVYQKLFDEGQKTPAIRQAEEAIAKAEGGGQ